MQDIFYKNLAMQTDRASGDHTILNKNFYTVSLDITRECRV